MALKFNPRNRSKIYEQFEIYTAGIHAASRDMHLARARCFQDKPMRKLFVGFARDCHHEYLQMMRLAS